MQFRLKLPLKEEKDKLPRPVFYAMGACAPTHQEQGQEEETLWDNIAKQRAQLDKLRRDRQKPDEGKKDELEKKIEALKREIQPKMRKINKLRGDMDRTTIFHVIKQALSQAINQKEQENAAAQGSICIRLEDLRSEGFIQNINVLAKQARNTCYQNPLAEPEGCRGPMVFKYDRSKMQPYICFFQEQSKGEKLLLAAYCCGSNGPHLEHPRDGILNKALFFFTDDPDKLSFQDKLLLFSACSQALLTQGFKYQRYTFPIFQAKRVAGQHKDAITVHAATYNDRIKSF